MKEGPFSKGFDEWFEELSRLAQEDPDAFERRRKELIEEAIQQANPVHHERLRQLQWRIDMERRRCKTPLASCIKLHEMLWDIFANPQNSFLEAVENLKTIVFGLKKLYSKSEDLRSCLVQSSNSVSKAKIIPFPKHKRR